MTDNNDDVAENKATRQKIGFIGAGHMAQTMINGFIAKGIFKPNEIIVSAPSDRNLSKLKPLGVITTHCNRKTVEQSPIIVLAVKPNLINIVLNNINTILLLHQPLIISVAAGVSTHTIEETLHLMSSEYEARVIRVMPNVPCMVFEGCCGYSLGKWICNGDEANVRELLSAVGICEKVTDFQMDAVCGLSGSGPAYVYAMIEAMSDGAVKMGLPRNIALKFAAQTVRGAATMVLQTEKHPAVLKDEVCSPGGTTIAGMHALEKNGLRNSLISAVEASALRSKEFS